MARKEIRVVAKSIFHNGKQAIKSQLTQKWIEMINQLEKRKMAGTKKV